MNIANNVNLSVLIPIAAYLIFLYFVALWSNKVNKAGEIDSSAGGFLGEYFIGGRSMGGFVLAFTMAATYASGSSFLGGPGVAYKMGLGWVLLAMIQVPTALLTLGVLGKKFAIVARRIDALTINDFLRARYESPHVVLAAAASMLIFFTATMTAQFVAGARLLESVTGMPYAPSLIIFAGTVVVYTTIGGFRAVVLTDTLQGIVMSCGVFLLLFAVVNAAGGMESAVLSLKAIDASLISPYGPGHFISKPFILSFWVLVGFGVIGLPFSAVRCMGYKDSKSMHRGIIISTAVITVLMLGMHLCGALGRAVLPNIEEVDTIIPKLSLALLSPAIAGIFLAGPLAAIMSTVDSQLIMASSALIKDIYINYINKNFNNKKIYKLTIIATALMGVLPFIFAYKPPSIIVWINLFAFGGLEAAFLFPIVLGLYWKRANAAGALASMAVGVISFIALSANMKRFLDMNVIVPSICAALLAFVLVSLISKKPEERIIRLFWGR